jgi:hypothetical protein
MYKLLVVSVLGLIMSTNANAILMTEVSDNAYISKGGYDIAWASPCAQVSPSCGVADYSFQAAFGWAAMSQGLFNSLAIVASDFLIAGGNVDALTGNNLDEISGATLFQNPSLGDIAIATPWFSNSFVHADWANGAAGFWSFSDNNGSAIAESLAVRESSDVPEPVTLALMSLGLLGIGFSRRRMAV